MVMAWVGVAGSGTGCWNQRRSSSPTYRTVLSVSKSQSLGRGRVQEETVKSCWSTASSGTKARLSPLKDIAGSKEQVKGKRCISHSGKYNRSVF